MTGRRTAVRAWFDRLARHGGPLGGASAVLLVASVLGAVAGYAFWFGAARRIPADVVGQLASVVSALAIVALVVTAGLAPAVAVAVARATPQDRSRIATTGLAAAAAAAAVLGVVVVVAARWVAPLALLAGSPLAGIAFVAAAMAAAMASVTDAAANAVSRPRVVLARTAVQGVVRLALLGVALVGTTSVLNLDVALVVWAGAASAATCTGLVVLARVVPLGARPDVRTAVALARSAGWHQAATLAAQIPSFLLPIVVAGRAGAEANAGFYVAWQMAGGCFMVSAAIAPTLLARLAAGDDHEAVMRSGTRLLLLLLAPVTAAVVLVGPFVLALLGPVYREATLTLVVLALAAYPDGRTAFHSARWRVHDQGHRAAALNAMMATAALAGAWVLVPRLGPVGAAWAFLGAQVAGTVVARGVTRRTAS